MPEAKRILLAVSGGIDSMYMAYRAPELFPGAYFAVAHCNFRLRGAESDGDEAFVRQWCEVKGIECFVKRFDTRSFATERGVSLEMAARELRYTWFEELRREQGFDAVAVAHNAKDDAETLILNLLRGTGIDGICGMRNSGTLLRPLLNTTREEIHSWMEARGLWWREDRTNSESEVKRNKIRNGVFPVFAQINPSFVRTLQRDMRRFSQVRSIADRYFEAHKRNFILEDGRIDFSRLITLDDWEYLLWRALEGSKIGDGEFSDLVRALKSEGQMAGRVFGPVTASSRELIITNGSCKLYKPIAHKLLQRSQIVSLKRPGVLFLDASAIPPEPKFRPWRAGDWLQPLGMKGKKKISDLFVDLKWNSLQKAGALVLELEGSHVAALLCERIDESVKVTDSTKEILSISFGKEQ